MFFSVDISTTAYFFIICVKKQNFLKIAEKWHHICQKRYHYVDNAIRTREMFIILNPTSLIQAIRLLNVSAKFE